jgi:hypothetical protein
MSVGRLRWRFDFSDGRPAKWGGWNYRTQRPEEMAVFVNKEGLTKASVEAEHPETFQILTVAECPGADFVNFAWMDTWHGNVNGGGSYQKIAGLKMVTRETEVEVYCTGEMRVVPRTEEDKKFHYAGFGR